MSTSILSMPSTTTDIRGALLVGSMPLADSAAVFTFAAQHLDRHLKRIPDGETGSRINWTQWQVGVFNAVDALESEIFDAGYLRRPKFRLKAEKRAEDIVAHDLWNGVIRQGTSSEREQIMVARVTVVAVCVVAVALAIMLRQQNVIFLTGLTVAIAASANFPALFLALFWRGLTTAGAVSGILFGAVAALVLIYGSPSIQVDVFLNRRRMYGFRFATQVSCQFLPRSPLQSLFHGVSAPWQTFPVMKAAKAAD